MQAIVGRRRLGKFHFVNTAFLLATLALTGCATSRSVITTEVDSGRNPSNGVAVRIEKVEDARVFKINPPSSDIPSLMNGEINDKTITSRAIARKRNGFGRALGDVLLPEGQNVPQIVQAAVTRAFRESGYRVLAPGEPGYEKAMPIAVRVDHFWSWLTPGFWAIAVEFRANVFLKSTVASLGNGRSFSTQTRENMQIVTESDWQDTATKGVNNLVDAIKKGLAETSRAGLKTGVTDN